MPLPDLFYPIVPDLGWLERLVPLGIKTIQLRLKSAEEGEIRRQIAAGRALCETHDCLFIVNDYWRQAIDLGAPFVHLGQEDLRGADVGAIRRAGLGLGISTHDEAELETALAADPDYVALGPIYETKLKKMRWAPQGLARIATWRARAPRPVVAIGGITLERAEAVRAAGAHSIAVVTDIVSHPEPEARVAAWLAWRSEVLGRGPERP